MYNKHTGARMQYTRGSGRNSEMWTHKKEWYIYQPLSREDSTGGSGSSLL